MFILIVNIYIEITVRNANNLMKPFVENKNNQF